MSMCLLSLACARLVDYPWNLMSVFTSNFKIYLYLPDFQDPPDPHKIMRKSPSQLRLRDTDRNITSSTLRRRVNK